MLRAIVVNVEGPDRASPQATLAVAEADLVLIGPGSFVGSTLAALTTGDLADAVDAGERGVKGHADGTFP